MIRILKSYLGRDLAKATALALVVFTIVLTVFAVIEPLRERGLSGIQALRLFGFIMPVMVSLTLPVAALFAATIVYGRFSQDNELMACRASGICTLAVLRPAVWLGALVTVVTLALGLYVAPRLLWESQYAVQSNLGHIAFHGLRTRGMLELEGRIFRAEHVDPGSGWLEGVVGLDTSNRDDVIYFAADRAKLDFSQREGKTFAVFQLENWTAARQSGGPVFDLEREQIRRGELPDLLEDEPKLYDWTRLRQAQADPGSCRVVQKETREIRQRLAALMFYEDVLRSAGHAAPPDGSYRLDRYDTLGEGGARRRIELRSPSAALSADGREVVLGATPTGGATRPGERGVVVRELEGDALKRTYRARDAVLRAKWDDYRQAHLVTVLLRDVQLEDPGQPLAPGREKEEIGPYALPDEIVQASAAADLRQIQAHPERFTYGRQVARMVRFLDERVIKRLLARVSAEIHLRLAYGASCLFLVMLGAALGLLFRGGQMLAAFAICAVPMSLLIALLIMGKELIRNPGVPQPYGVAVIWGAVAALAGATAYVYAVPMRR